MKCSVKDVVDFYRLYPEFIGQIQTLTRYGYKTVDYADITAYDSTILEIKTKNRFIECSPEHRLWINNDWKSSKNCSVGDLIDTVDGNERIESITQLSFTEDLYDFQVSDVNEYYTNGITSHNSTILDSITFGLFGKPFRKINKPSLINSINEKNCLVEIEFSIGKKDYLIRRGMKPNVFEILCDGVLLNQSASTKDYQEILEKQILKMNYRSFTQIVILGSASFTPFMQLSPADRRIVIEDLLDIKIFSQMHSIIKDKLILLKDLITKKTNDIMMCAEKIKMQKSHIETLKRHNKEEILKKEQEKEKILNDIEKINSEIELIKKHVDELLNEVKSVSDIETKKKDMIIISSKIESNISKFLNEKEFFKNHDNCPTCKQLIQQDFKLEKIQETELKLEKNQEAQIKIKEELKKINDKLTSINKISKIIIDNNTEITKKKTMILGAESYIKRLEKEIKELSNENVNITNEIEVLRQLKSNLKDLLKQKTELQENKYYQEYAYNLFKDNGIKTKIIKQYLPLMNNLINKYLEMMDSYINFNLDENFNETIKSRHRDDFSYFNFSEGEKQKIDFALLFTWRQIAKMKNSTNTNLLILDEVFDSSLDSTSLEFLSYILKDFSKDNNIFVISHKGDILFDKFRSVIQFEKRNNFSEIVK